MTDRPKLEWVYDERRDRHVAETTVDGFNVRFTRVDDKHPDLSFLGQFHHSYRPGAVDWQAFIGLPEHKHENRWLQWYTSTNYNAEHPKNDDERADIVADIKRLHAYGESWGMTDLIVIVAKAGVELSCNILGGIESDAPAEFVLERCWELADEAVAEAKAALPKLREELQK